MTKVVESLERKGQGMASDAAEEKGKLNEGMGNKLKIFFKEFITIELTLSPNLTKLNSLSRLLDMDNGG